MATQVERRDATQRAILDAAVANFCTTGDLSASMESIASDAGVTKGSIHYHFGSRHGLLRAVAELTIVRLEKHIANGMAMETEVADVRTWVRAVLAEQATPRGRMLYAINDELAGSGALDNVDPFPYFTLRLSEFDIPSPPPVIAAALLQYGRQLAFNTSSGTIDDVMADLDELL